MNKAVQTRWQGRLYLKHECVHTSVNSGKLLPLLSYACGTVLRLIQEVEWLGRNCICIIIPSSLALFDDICKRKINYCGTVCQSRKFIPPNFGPEDSKARDNSILGTKELWGLYVGRTDGRSVYWPTFFPHRQEETSEMNAAVLWNLWPLKAKVPISIMLTEVTRCPPVMVWAEGCGSGQRSSSCTSQVWSLCVPSSFCRSCGEPISTQTTW